MSGAGGGGGGAEEEVEAEDDPAAVSSVEEGGREEEGGGVDSDDDEVKEDDGSGGIVSTGTAGGSLLLSEAKSLTLQLAGNEGGADNEELDCAGERVSLILLEGGMGGWGNGGMEGGVSGCVERIHDTKFTIGSFIHPPLSPLTKNCLHHELLPPLLGSKRAIYCSIIIPDGVGVVEHHRVITYVHRSTSFQQLELRYRLFQGSTAGRLVGGLS